MEKIEIEIGWRLWSLILVLGLVFLINKFETLMKKIKLSTTDWIEWNLKKKGNIIKWGKKEDDN